MEKLQTILGKIFIGLAVVAFIGLLLGFPIKWLWNWVAVDLFAFPRIDFWQALGLNLLCGGLFGRHSSKSDSK